MIIPETTFQEPDQSLFSQYIFQYFDNLAK